MVADVTANLVRSRALQMIRHAEQISQASKADSKWNRSWEAYASSKKEMEDSQSYTIMRRQKEMASSLERRVAEQEAADARHRAELQSRLISSMKAEEEALARAREEERERAAAHHKSMQDALRHRERLEQKKHDMDEKKRLKMKTLMDDAQRRVEAVQKVRRAASPTRSHDALAARPTLSRRTSPRCVERAAPHPRPTLFFRVQARVAAVKAKQEHHEHKRQQIAAKRRDRAKQLAEQTREWQSRDDERKAQLAAFEAARQAELLERTRASELELKRAGGAR